MSNNSVDLLILGGGLAGLSLALQCKQRMPEISICVLEKNAHPVPEAAHKVGESSVEIAAEYFANVLGLKDHILQQQLPKMGLRFFFPYKGNHAIEDRLELGGKIFPPTPSYQLDRGRFENFLGEQCRELGVSFIDEAKVREIDLRSKRKGHHVSYSHDGETKTCTARFLVDASGRTALLKRQLGLQKENSHTASAAWFRVDAKVSVDDWSSDEAWKEGHSGDTSRWFSTNHLMGEGYWVWLIPLASGSTSVGIVADERIHPLKSYNSEEKAMQWLQAHEPQCARMLAPYQGAFQDFLALKNYSHDCKKVFSSRRWGITGEAGLFLDPFYSPGSDFIAFANTFLTELITREMSGKTNLFHAPIYDALYKTFYRGTYHVYDDTYPVFGTHRVMPIKILWDYMIYWTLTSYLFFHQRMTNPFTYMFAVPYLQRISKLNAFMQTFFVRWGAQMQLEDIGGSINMSEIPIIFNTNKALQDELTTFAFHRRFAANAKQIESLFWEIIEEANLDIDVPFRRRVPKRDERYFEKVYQAIQMGVKQETQTGEPAQAVGAG